jgi:hypothetical protein
MESDDNYRDLLDVTREAYGKRAEPAPWMDRPEFASMVEQVHIRGLLRRTLMDLIDGEETLAEHHEKVRQLAAKQETVAPRLRGDMREAGVSEKDADELTAPYALLSTFLPAYLRFLETLEGNDEP